jgi:hypothetical protein
MRPIEKMLNNSGITLETLNEVLPQIKKRIKLIENDKIAELRDMLDCWPVDVASEVFKDGVIDTIPAGQRIAKLSVSLNDLKKLLNKVNEKIMNLSERPVTAPPPPPPPKPPTGAQEIAETLLAESHQKQTLRNPPLQVHGR